MSKSYSTLVSSRCALFLAERRWCRFRRAGISRAWKRASARAERHAARLALAGAA